MVYVAVFINQGVLKGLEVFTDPKDAEQQAEKWRKKSNPDKDVVQVLEREIKIDLARRFPHLARD